jgi:hypothetical protein
LHRSFPNDAVANVKLFPLVLAKKKKLGIVAINIADIFMA